MRGGAWLALGAAEVSLLFTLTLLPQAVRSRRLHLGSWTLALSFFTLGAAGLWYGSAFGWSQLPFRFYYVFGALLGVPWLALGQLQLLLGRRASGAGTLLLAAFTAVAGFIVALSPLAGPVHGRSLPDGHHLLGTLPLVLVAVSNSAGTAVLVGGVGYSVLRMWRRGPAARARAEALLLIMLGALVAGAGGTLTFLGQVGANATGILVGVSLMYAGFVASGRRVGRHRG